jgi:hypothetical protein
MIWLTLYFIINVLIFAALLIDEKKVRKQVDVGSLCGCALISFLPILNIYTLYYLLVYDVPQSKFWSKKVF